MTSMDTPAQPGITHNPRPQDSAWIWAPHAVTAVLAAIGTLLRLGGGGAALTYVPLVAMAPLFLIVAFLGARAAAGRPMLGARRIREVAYLACVAAFLGVWLYSVGTPDWFLACGLVAAAAGGSLGWWLWTARNATVLLTGVAGGFAALCAGLFLVGPDRHPEPVRWAIAWAAGTGFAAIPWWSAHRRRDTPILAVVAHEDLDRLIETFGRHANTRLVMIEGTHKVDSTRWSVRLRTSGGRTVKELMRFVENTEAELRWRPGAITILPSMDSRDEFEITVTPEMPDPDAVPRPPFAESMTDPMPIGRHDDGRPMFIRSYHKDWGAQHTIGAGETGSGKSMALKYLLGSITRTGSAVLLFADLSGGATSWPWRHCSQWTATTDEEVIKQLRALNEIAPARSAELPKRRWRCWRPSKKHPAIVLAIDEWQSLAARSQEAQLLLNKLIQVARKSGIVILLFCPRPSADQGIYPVLRDQMKNRLCFRSTGTVPHFVFGNTPAVGAAQRCAEFPLDLPGKLLATGLDLDPVEGRAFYMDDEEEEGVSAAHGPLQPDPDELTGAILRKHGQRRPPVDDDPTDMFNDDPTQVSLSKPSTGHATAVDGEMGEWTAEQTHGAVLAVLERPGPVTGRTWPVHDTPPAPKLTIPQSLEAMKDMLVRAGGATTGECEAITGRSSTWVNKQLRQWVESGCLERKGHGRYQWMTTSSDAA